MKDIEKMVSLKGMVIRCSSIIPEIREAVFRCLVCGYFTDSLVVDRGTSLSVHLILLMLLYSIRGFCSSRLNVLQC